MPKYVVGFKIFDIRDLLTRNGQMVDPYVYVTCANEQYKTDIKQSKQAICSFDEGTTWSQIELDEEQFELTSIEFRVFARNWFSRDTLIGMATFQLASINSRRSHVYSKKWAILRNSAILGEGDPTPSGSIKITVYCLRPGDIPPSLEEQERETMDTTDEGETENVRSDLNLSTAVLGGDAGGSSSASQRAHHVLVSIHRVADLSCQNSLEKPQTSISPFVTVEFANSTVSTSIAKNSTGTHSFNETIRIAAVTPLFEDSIAIKLWHYTPRWSDEIVAQGSVSFSDLRNNALSPVWFNFYAWTSNDWIKAKLKFDESSDSSICLKELVTLTSMKRQVDKKVTGQPNLFIGRLLVSACIFRIENFDDVEPSGLVSGHYQLADEPPQSSVVILADVVQFSLNERQLSSSYSKGPIFIEISMANTCAYSSVVTRDLKASISGISNFTFSEIHGKIRPVVTMLATTIENKVNQSDNEEITDHSHNMNASKNYCFINVFELNSLSGSSSGPSGGDFTKIKSKEEVSIKLRKIAYARVDLSKLPLFDPGDPVAPKFIDVIDINTSVKCGNLLLSIARHTDEDVFRPTRKLSNLSKFCLRSYVFMARNIGRNESLNSPYPDDVYTKCLGSRNTQYNVANLVDWDSHKSWSGENVSHSTFGHLKTDEQRLCTEVYSDRTGGLNVVKLASILRGHKNKPTTSQGVYLEVSCSGVSNSTRILSSPQHPRWMELVELSPLLLIADEVGALSHGEPKCMQPIKLSLKVSTGNEEIVLCSTDIIYDQVRHRNVLDEWNEWSMNPQWISLTNSKGDISCEVLTCFELIRLEHLSYCPPKSLVSNVPMTMIDLDLSVIGLRDVPGVGEGGILSTLFSQTKHLSDVEDIVVTAYASDFGEYVDVMDDNVEDGENDIASPKRITLDMINPPTVTKPITSRIRVPLGDVEESGLFDEAPSMSIKSKPQSKITTNNTIRETQKYSSEQIFDLRREIQSENVKFRHSTAPLNLEKLSTSEKNSICEKTICNSFSLFKYSKIVDGGSNRSLSDLNKKWCIEPSAEKTSSSKLSSLEILRTGELQSILVPLDPIYEPCLHLRIFINVNLDQLASDSVGLNSSLIYNKNVMFVGETSLPLIDLFPWCYEQNVLTGKYEINPKAFNRSYLCQNTFIERPPTLRLKDNEKKTSSNDEMLNISPKLIIENVDSSGLPLSLRKSNKTMLTIENNDVNNSSNMYTLPISIVGHGESSKATGGVDQRDSVERIESSRDGSMAFPPEREYFDNSTDYFGLKIPLSKGWFTFTRKMDYGLGGDVFQLEQDKGVYSGYIWVGYRVNWPNCESIMSEFESVFSQICSKNFEDFKIQDIENTSTTSTAEDSVEEISRHQGFLSNYQCYFLNKLLNLQNNVFHVNSLLCCSISKTFREKNRFNLFNENDLRFRFKDRKYLPSRVRVRLYIVDAICIFGRGSSGPSKDSYADPYFTCTLGNNDAISTRSLHHVKTNTPQFFRIEEKDVTFPNDSRLVVSIWDYSDSLVLADELIGTTVIDLEERWYNDKFQINYNETQLVPIENRPIWQKTKDHLYPIISSGTVSLWVELIDVSNAAEIKLSELRPPPAQVIEMRLVIWGCTDVKLVDGDHSDVMIETNLDCQSYSGEHDSSQTTDVHYNSTDGHAIFNWRVLYPNIVMPTQSAILQIALYDYNAIADNIFIGEVNLDIRKYLEKVARETDAIEMSATLDIYEPQSREISGKVRVSLYVLTQSEASANPVGIGRNEPNTNPQLIAPLEGRGWGDVLAGAGFKFNINWALFGKLKWVFLVLFILILLVVLKYIGFI